MGVIGIIPILFWHMNMNGEAWLELLCSVCENFRLEYGE